MDTNNCPSSVDLSRSCPAATRPGEDNGGKLLLKNEVFQIVGCAIEVLNTLGNGLIEKPYENALVVEFGLREIPFRRRPPFDVFCKGQKVALFIPDLMAFDVIVTDTKVIDKITDHERGLMLNYANNEAASWRDPQFQAPEIGVAANCL